MAAKENLMKSQKLDIERNLAGQLSILKDKESELTFAESDLQAAERN